MLPTVERRPDSSAPKQTDELQELIMDAGTDIQTHTDTSANITT